MENIKVNMTPLVDVCLSLLIVFLVSGSLFIQPSLTIDPPKAVTNEETEETEKIFVSISKDNDYAVDDMIVSVDMIEEVLTDKLENIESKRVVIRADKDTLHGNLLKVMAVAKNSGAKQITIATVQKNK